MFNAHGWIIIRSSRAKYAGIDAMDPLIERLDDEVKVADKLVWDAFELFLESMRNRTLLRGQFIRDLNHVSGYFGFLISRNHSKVELDNLLDWIITNAVGSYGIVYIHKDEGPHPNEFRIIRINRGAYSEHADPFLSPIFPTVEYEPL